MSATNRKTAGDCEAQSIGSARDNGASFVPGGYQILFDFFSPD